MDVHGKISFIEFCSSFLDCTTGFGIKQHSLLDDTKIQKNFYVDGIKEEGSRREWLVYQNERFRCTICLSFGVKTKRNNIFISGADYEEPFSRFSQKITRHADSEYHKASVKQYLDSFSSTRNYLTSYSSVDDTERQVLRIAVKIIIKIVIYLATHSE